MAAARKFIGLLGDIAEGAADLGDDAYRNLLRLIEAGFPDTTAMKIVTGELPMDNASRMARATEQNFTEKAYHTGKNAMEQLPDGSYQKTGRGIISIDPEDVGYRTQAGSLFASGKTPEISQSYTGNLESSPTSYPLLVNTDNFEKVNAFGQRWNSISSPEVYFDGDRMLDIDGYNPKSPLYGNESVSTNELAKDARRRGASGVVINDVRDIGHNSLRMYDTIRQRGLDQNEWNKAYRSQGGQIIAINDGTKARSLLGAAFDPDQVNTNNLLATNPAATSLAGLLSLLGISEADGLLSNNRYD